MRAAWIIGLGLGLGASGCPQPDTFECRMDSQCESNDQLGQCTAAGYCAFEDPNCESGWAYGELAHPNLAGTCVPVEGGSGSTTAEGTGDGTGTNPTNPTTASGEASSTGLADDTGGCSPGAPCMPEVACALAGICDERGICVPTETLECDEPPGPCYMPVGDCTARGCVYQPQSREIACDDANECTQDDHCDGAGECVGVLCPSDDPCQQGVCDEDMGRCSFDDIPEGGSCGPNPSDRCCGGVCVDISTDSNHCGKCGAACTEGNPCLPLEQEMSCDEGVSNVSGRCACPEGMINLCPPGQQCSGPFGHCYPESPADCSPASHVEVPLPGMEPEHSCDYCAY